MLRLHKKPVVSVFVRHRDECPHAFSKEINPQTGQPRRDESYPKCDCAKWLRFSLNGKQHKQAAGTRTWGLAEEKAQELQKQLDSGRGAAVAPVSHDHATIADEILTFVKGKESENISEATVRKLKYQLNLFEQFMTKRSKFYPADITKKDVIDYRDSWTWSDLTKIKAQQNLRGFIRASCKGNHRTDLLDALGRIKETKQGRERRKPKPLTEKEIKTLLAQVPVTFANEPAKIPRHQAMIRLMVSTGLAIVDAVQLERTALEQAKKTKVLTVERQKTNKPARIPIDSDLVDELNAVLNGNPRYVFWHGNALADSETKRLQGEMRELMKAAGVYIKGNLFHRLRDTAVDFWLGQGWSLTDIAAALGDTLTVVEKHYKDLESQRQEDRLATLPVRKW
jgi:integrase